MLTRGGLPLAALEVGGVVPGVVDADEEQHQSDGRNLKQRDAFVRPCRERRRGQNGVADASMITLKNSPQRLGCTRFASWSIKGVAEDMSQFRFQRSLERFTYTYAPGEVVSTPREIGTQIDVVAFAEHKADPCAPAR